VGFNDAFGAEIRELQIFGGDAFEGLFGDEADQLRLDDGNAACCGLSFFIASKTFRGGVTL